MIIFLHHIKSDAFVIETTNISFPDCSPQQDDILKGKQRSVTVSK